MAPVEASTCSDDDFRDREYSFFFDGGNCSLQTGAKCLYGANRFTSAEECYKSCVVTGEPGCRVPRMQRACPLRQKRFGFYFDRSLSACVAWRTACLAPPNRHASYSACSEACEQNLLKKIIGG
ncbi:uncharacterized protein LOC144175359 [Haemaphysalis longicornis]